MELAAIRQAKVLMPSVGLDRLADRARDDARSSTDHMGIILGNTRMRLDGTWMFNGDTGPLSRHALNQVCSRLELPTGGTVPAGYLARCPSPLAAQNLNHWLSHSANGQQVLVRTRTESGRKRPIVRAVLSERYALVDHLPLIEVLRELIPKHNLKLQHWSLDDEQLTLRILVDADHPASLKDPIRVGIHVSNSEIGLGRISITALITRLVCTNGLVVKVADLGGFQRRHIGRVGEDLESVVREALPRVLEEADEAGRRFVQLRQLPAPEPVEEFLKRTASEMELPDTVLPLLSAVLEGSTLYDVVNAFTRIAQRYPVAERVRIESHVSQFLRGPRSAN